MTDDARSAPAEDTTGLDATDEATSTEADERATDREPSTADLERERDEYYDMLLRKTAEFDNYRKRIDRERRELLENAGADILVQLLPIIDDLERALEADAESATASAYREGVEIIHRQLLDLLRKHRVTPIVAVGTEFDPHVHQAVVHEPSASHREGEVVAELRRGYMIGDRLLRPAMVKVAKRE